MSECGYLAADAVTDEGPKGEGPLGWPKPWTAAAKNPGYMDGCRPTAAAAAAAAAAVTDMAAASDITLGASFDGKSDATPVEEWW